jgi:presenilin-like A22 family membrane protease
MVQRSFKADFVHLVPILISLLFGVLCAFLLLDSSVGIYNVTPFSEGAVGSIGNALYFVILVGVGASLLFFLIKRRSHRLIMFVTGFALTTAVFMLSLFYLFSAFANSATSSLEGVIVVAAIVITILADIVIFTKRSRVYDIVVLCLGGALGTFLGASIPTLSALLILCFLAVYDTFAVYRGPMGKIARSGLDQLRGLSFSFREIQMGLGDLTFYSMLSGHMLLNFGLISGLAAIIGVLLGCFLAFKMLEKYGMFPGLPFPIFLGITAGLLVLLL